MNGIAPIPLHQDGEVEPLRPESDGIPSPLVMLDRAIARGADLAMVEKLLDLQERHERNEARRAFDHAIAAVRAEIPPILKNRKVEHGTKAGGQKSYRHEDLAEIARTVDPILARHGLSYRYRTTSEPNAPIVVTCIISHELGHREENTLTGGRDDSGQKNSLQAIGSTLTYLQRYTLKASLGLAAAEDDDGKAAGSNLSGDVAPAATIMEMREKLAFIGRDEAQFLAYANNRLGLELENLDDLPVEKVAAAQKLIDAAVSTEERRRTKESSNG